MLPVPTPERYGYITQWEWEGDWHCGPLWDSDAASDYDVSSHSLLNLQHGSGHHEVDKNESKSISIIGRQVKHFSALCKLDISTISVLDMLRDHGSQLQNLFIYINFDTQWVRT